MPAAVAEPTCPLTLLLFVLLHVPLVLQAVVDVVLGDTPVLSRQHCRIIYNFHAKKWQLVVEVRRGTPASKQNVNKCTATA